MNGRMTRGIEVVTIKVRPHAAFHENGNGEDDDVCAYSCAAHYEHPEDGETWVSVGAADTYAGAQDDLRSLLEEAGIEAPILVECRDARKRNSLIWSVKARAMMDGVSLVVVEE